MNIPAGRRNYRCLRCKHVSSFPWSDVLTIGKVLRCRPCGGTWMVSDPELDVQPVIAPPQPVEKVRPSRGYLPPPSPKKPAPLVMKRTDP